MPDRAFARTFGWLSIYWRDSVITVVGATALTRMMCGAHSITSMRVIRIKPGKVYPDQCLFTAHRDNLE